MKHTKFVVSSFEKRNGNTSWRVDGYFNGVRIRKNFKTREEAAAEQTMLELKAQNAANEVKQNLVYLKSAIEQASAPASESFEL